MVPPSLRRVPRNGSPASTVLWGAPTPHRPSRPASMSRGDTTVASVIRSPRPRTRCRGPGSCWFRSPHPKSTVETSGSLRFLGNPNGHCPCSSTPVGPAAFYGTKCSATDTAPAYVHDEGSRRFQLSGLNHTALGLAVYASQGKSPDPTQDSLLAAGPALPGGIDTRWVPVKGFRVRGSSSFSKLA
jgi:hypothetical protein